jgi:hypothetical protein
VSARQLPARAPRPWPALAIVLAGAAGLQGCAKEAPSRPPATVYSEDLRGGAAHCTTSEKLTPADGQPTETRIAVGNDGGWCAVTVAAPGDEPFAAGLLTTRPQHGRVYVHTVGYATRIDYTPVRGYTGPDAFAVELLPGSATLRVSVTVQPPGAPPKA